MAKYILTGKNTIGFREDSGEFRQFRKGDEVPENIYKRLPERVQGYITVSDEEKKDTLFANSVTEAPVEEVPESEEFPIEEDSAEAEKKSSKRKKKSD